MIQGSEEQTGKEPADDSAPLAPLAKWQRVAFWVAVVCGLLALGTGAGCTVLPKDQPMLALLIHPLVLVLGAFCGFASIGRSREIDRERWRIVEDDTLTRGERTYAHREADTRSRQAGTAFFLAALAVGGLLGYQLREPGTIGPADLLTVTPLAGFLIGLVVGVKKLPKPTPRF